MSPPVDPLGDASTTDLATPAKNIYGFLRFAALDLDYQISDPVLVAEETESLANDEQGERRHSLMHSAARAYRAAKNQPDRDRCLVDAAEALVVVADGHRSSAMGETHWLEKAVNELRRLPAAKARCLELKHRLIDAQSRILDEMQSFSHSDDITEVVDHARSAVTDKPLATTLRIFAILSHAPDPDALEDEARRMIAEHPLSSLFASTHYDGRGKPVHRTPGGGLGDDSDRSAIDEKIAQSEKIRRSIVATGTIEPMRQTIVTEHNVDDRAISLLCNHSRFVPSDRVAIFSSGLGHFFQGDMIAALHTLLPQIENSLRHILRLHGHDVIKINDDLTQEDMGFTQLLARLRPQLDEIFGAAMITDLENTFIYRGGPQLRDRTTHGLIGQWEPFSEDSIYACWLIYQLCCLPLLPYWKQLEDALNA